MECAIGNLRFSIVTGSRSFFCIPVAVVKKAPLASWRSFVLILVFLSSPATSGILCKLGPNSNLVFMIAPFPLYVDEITDDNIKATVSNSIKVIYNLRMMSLDMPVPHRGCLFNMTNGIFIVPVGRFICMLVRDTGKSDMIMLDLIHKEELAEKMSEKLPQAELQDKFMNVYAESISHPENHRKFRLITGFPGEELSMPSFRTI